MSNSFKGSAPFALKEISLYIQAQPIQERDKQDWLLALDIASARAPLIYVERKFDEGHFYHCLMVNGECVFKSVLSAVTEGLKDKLDKALAKP